MSLIGPTMSEAVKEIRDTQDVIAYSGTLV